jgi:RNA polymerase sigma-70 factor (ECF subfamily)
MTDIDKLIKQCQKKSTKAFDELYKLYSPLIFGICLRYTKDNDEAQDLMQECFIKILNKINDYEFKGSFEGWIRRLTVNNAINYLKLRKNFLVEDINDYENLKDNYDPDVISNMNAQEIVKLINQLPVGYRTIFNLYAVEGYKHIEIAEMLGVSEVTCRTQFKKARTSLMKLIENYDERF